MPVIMGINDPQYTPEELEQFRQDNEKGFEYDGKHYTQYEATQRQRGLERSIRKKKRQILIDESLGDTDRLPIDQTRYVILQDEYRRFSKAAGLRTQERRMEVPGFGAKSHRVAEAALRNKNRTNPLAKEYADSDSEIVWPDKGDSITTEQYRELRTYAESKGVLLQGVKNSDVDLSLMKEAVDTAESFLERYPELKGSERKPFTLYLDRFMKSVDFAEVKNGVPHIMHLNADAFRSSKALHHEYGKLADEGWFVRGSTYRSVIHHEIGHMVSEVYGIDGLAVMKQVLNTDSTAETLLWCKANLSDYSFKSDGTEIISEVFSAFYGTEKPSKEIVDFMSMCDKIILDRRG